jgi:RHS repeat-associated protein
VGTSWRDIHKGDLIDEPISILQGGTTSYYETDALGSTTSLSGATGTLANSYTYDSFGNLTNSTGSLSNPFRYTARELDTETGMYYYRARYYDPGAGRFLSEDPISFATDIDFYLYVHNDPISYIDPSGLQHYRPMPDKPKPLDPSGDVMDLARELEHRHFPADKEHPENVDPYGGGYRHCVAACLLKRRWGAVGDLLVWTWDTVNEDSTDQNSRDDMAAEKRGKCRASGRSSCENECLKDFPSPAPKLPRRRQQ